VEMWRGLGVGNSLLQRQLHLRREDTRPGQANILRTRARIPMSFEEIRSRVLGVFHDYCIIIIYAYDNYNCIINSWYNNYISDKVLLE